MSDLIAELSNPPAKASGFAGWLLEQEPATRKALEAAGGDSRWSTYALMNLLRKYGASCSRETVGAWRIKQGYVDS